MLDNFRRRDNPLSRSPDPYSQLQGALAPRSAESTKPEASKPETSRPETSKPEAPKADAREHSRPSRSGEEAVSKLIVGPDIKLKGAEISGDVAALAAAKGAGAARATGSDSSRSAPSAGTAAAHAPAQAGAEALFAKPAAPH